MDRANHYEAAFEGYLQWHRYSYVAVDETRRSYLGDERVKSLDFIVHGRHRCGWLIDVKGRRFPAGPAERPRAVWESWSTRDDVDSLHRWAECFGPRYQPLLVFMYQVMPYARRLPDGEDLWTWHGRRYLIRGVPVTEYRRWMRQRSPRWGTVALAAADYRRLVRPFHHFLTGDRTVEGASFAG